MKKYCEDSTVPLTFKLTNGGMRGYRKAGIKWNGKGYSTNHDPLRNNNKIKGT